MPATALLTSEQFLGLPDELDQHGNRVRQELIHGEVVSMPPPSRIHALVLSNVVEELVGYVLSNRHLGLKIMPEAAVVAGSQDTFVPDCSVMEVNRLNPRDQKYFRGAPALAVEVVSPSDTATRLKFKVDTYLTSGAQSVWVVYPDSRSVMVYSGGAVRELKGDQPIEDPLLPGFSVPVSRFFELV